MRASVQRKSLTDYERFIYGLCGLEPGEDRDRCALEIVRQLVAMYRERGADPPAGLIAFAEQIGIQESASGSAVDPQDIRSD